MMPNTTLCLLVANQAMHGMLILALVVLTGCADHQRQSDPPTATNAQTPSRSSSAETGPAQQQATRSQEIVEKRYGKIELSNWSQITLESIRGKLSPQAIQDAVGRPGPVEVTSSDGFALHYRWTKDPKKLRIEISIPLKEMSESDMMARVGALAEMENQGKARSVDLGVSGVRAYISRPPAGELSVLTADRLLIIDASMRSNVKSDEEFVAQCQVAVARELFKHFALE